MLRDEVLGFDKPTVVFVGEGVFVVTASDIGESLFNSISLPYYR